jgi:hypothetical protein
MFSGFPTQADARIYPAIMEKTTSIQTLFMPVPKEN